jgi:hypothetical protein
MDFGWRKNGVLIFIAEKENSLQCCDNCGFQILFLEIKQRRLYQLNLLREGSYNRMSDSALAQIKHLQLRYAASGSETSLTLNLALAEHRTQLSTSLNSCITGTISSLNARFASRSATRSFLLATKTMGRLTPIERKNGSQKRDTRDEVYASE